MLSFANAYCVVSISPQICKTLLFIAHLKSWGQSAFVPYIMGIYLHSISVFSFHCLLPYRGRSSMMFNYRAHLFICCPYHCIMLGWPLYATLILIIHSVILTSWLLRVHPMTSTTAMLLFKNALIGSTMWMLNLRKNGAIMKGLVLLIGRDSWSLLMQIKMRRRESSKNVFLVCIFTVLDISQVLRYSREHHRVPSEFPSSFGLSLVFPMRSAVCSLLFVFVFCDNMSHCLVVGTSLRTAIRWTAIPYCDIV